MTPLWRPSPNFDARPGAVDMVVLHYTDMLAAEPAVAWLCNPDSHVSAHYLIAADGRVVQMVAEEHRAWHAGQSYWRGVRDNNARSIGIELDNPGHRAGTAAPYPDVQINALLALLEGIRARHTIPARNIVGHSDIAPHRKLDPGERFPWDQLASAGHALAVPAASPHETLPRATDDAFAHALTAIGYAPAAAELSAIFGPLPAPGSTQSAPGGPTVPALLPAASDGGLRAAVTDAFHRRFLPSRLGASPDATSLATARAIADALGAADDDGPL